MPSTHVCLSSAANLDLFPGNEPTEFQNELPAPFVSRVGTYLSVSLVGLGVHTDVLAPRPAPTHLRVYLRELRGQAEGRRFVHLLGSVPLRRSGQYEYYTFRDSPRLSLAAADLHRLTVLIADENGAKIELAPCSPTVLWLELHEMISDAGQGNFTITCSSGHLELYSSNVPSKFISPLPNEMSLGDYQVALQNVVFPPHLKEGEDEARLMVEDETYVFHLSDYYTTEHFVRSVREKVNRGTYRNDLSLSYFRRSWPWKLHFRRSRDPEQVDDRTLLHIDMNGLFARACGNHAAPERGVDLDLDETYTFDAAPNLYRVRTEPVGMLHCNLIKPNILGGRRAQVLQCIPLKIGQRFNDQRSYDPEQLVFHDVVDSPVVNVGFHFTDSTGRDRHFTTPTRSATPLQLTLLFRRKTASE